LFWRNALLRLAGRELWEEGLQRFIFHAECQDIRSKLEDYVRGIARRDKRTRNADIGSSDSTNNASDALESTQGNTNISEPHLSSDNTNTLMSKQEILLDKACNAMEDHPPEHHTATSSGIYQCIYRSVLQHHVRYQAPVFYMPSSIRLGDDYGLHFFEPRYRLLIAEVLAPYPVSARRGERIQPLIPDIYPTNGRPIRDEALKFQLLNFLEQNESLIHQHQMPTFIHAHQSPLRPNTPATIVQIRHCQVSADGRADVLLKPIGYIWIEQLWERTGTGGLIEARGLRMEKETGLQYERWCAMNAFGNGDGRGRGQMLPIP
jgi:hypothetical protein